MGQAAWHHAQDQTSWHRSRRRRLPAQSYRLYPDPHSQTACRLATPRQGAPNTRLENYIQLHRAAPTTTGQNKTTLHFKALQQTVKAELISRHYDKERELAEKQATAQTIRQELGGSVEDTFTGNKLLDACRIKKAGFEEGYCFGYIVGSIQALRGAADTKGRICVPEGAT